MLGRLEKGIKDLVSRYEKADAENREYRESINMRDLEIKGLKKNIEKLNIERDQVRERVDALINHIEGLVSST